MLLLSVQNYCGLMWSKKGGHQKKKASVAPKGRAEHTFTWAQSQILNVSLFPVPSLRAMPSSKEVHGSRMDKQEVGSVGGVEKTLTKRQVVRRAGRHACFIGGNGSTNHS